MTMDMEMYQDRLTQGINLMRVENYEKAKECFEDAVRIQPKSAEAYRHLGNALANLGQYEEAIGTFQKILILNSNDGEALFSIGNIYVLRDQKLKAVEFYNKAEAAGYESAQMYQIMATIFFEADDVTQALRNINRAINVTPLDGELRLLKVRIYLAYDKYDEALETLDEMETILPDAYEAYDLKAQIYCGMQSYKAALESARKGRKRFPEDVNLAVTELKVLVLSDDRSTARALLEELKNSGMYETVLKDAALHEATLDIKDQKTEKAYEVLLSAHEKLPQDADILYLLVDLCAKTGHFDKTLMHSEELIKMECGDFYIATALFFHATALEETGDKERALTEFRTMIARLRRFTIENPSFYEGYIYRLLCHTKIGEYDKALELADYMESLYSDRADSHAFRHYIYREMGDLGKAEEEKKMAKGLNPDLNI